MKCYVLQCNQISAIAAVKLKAILRAYAAGGDEETSKSSAAAEFMSFALRPRFHRHTQIHFFFFFLHCQSATLAITGVFIAAIIFNFPTRNNRKHKLAAKCALTYIPIYI